MSKVLIAVIGLVPASIVGFGAVWRAEYVTAENKQSIHELRVEQKTHAIGLVSVQKDVETILKQGDNDRSIQNEMRLDIKAMTTSLIQIQSDLRYIKDRP